MFEGLLAPAHLVVIGVIALVVFGPGRVPEIGKALGQAVRACREGLKGEE